MENKSNNNNKFPEDTFIEEENIIKTSIKNQPCSKEKNININNELIRTTLNEKTEEISKIFDESLNKGNLIDEEEEESKDILLSLGFRKSKENDLLAKLSKTGKMSFFPFVKLIDLYPTICIFFSPF